MSVFITGAGVLPVLGTPISNLTEGTLIQINEDGSPVPFYLAKHDYEPDLNGSGRSLLVRKDGYKLGQYNSSGKNTYADSTIDTWHNNTYKPMLDVKVQELIGTTTFYYTKGGGTSGSYTKVTTLSRSVFQLSLTELGRSYGSANVEGSALPIASMLQVCYRNGTTSTNSQWTRSPAINNSEAVYILSYNGSATVEYELGDSSQYRPCFTLPATAMVVAEPNADGSYTLLV